MEEKIIKSIADIFENNPQNLSKNLKFQGENNMYSDNLPEQKSRTGFKNYNLLRSHASAEKMNLISAIYRTCGLPFVGGFDYSSNNCYYLIPKLNLFKKNIVNHNFTRKNLKHITQRQRGSVPSNLLTNFSHISMKLMAILKCYFADINNRDIFREPYKDRLFVAVENFRFLDEILSTMNFDSYSLTIFAKRIRLWWYFSQNINNQHPIGKSFLFEVFTRLYYAARGLYNELLIDYILRGIQNKLQESVNLVRSQKELLSSFITSGDLMKIDQNTYDRLGNIVSNDRYHNLCKRTYINITFIEEYYAKTGESLFNEIRDNFMNKSPNNTIAAIALYKNSIRSMVSNIMTEYQTIVDRCIINEHGNDSKTLRGTGGIAVVLGGNLIPDNSVKKSGFTENFVSSSNKNNQNTKRVVQDVVRIHGGLIKHVSYLGELETYLRCAEEFGNSVLSHIKDPVIETLNQILENNNSMSQYVAPVAARSPIRYDEYSSSEQSELRSLWDAGFSTAHSDSFIKRIEQLIADIRIQGDLYSENIDFVKLRKIFWRYSDTALKSLIPVDLMSLESYIRLLSAENSNYSQLQGELYDKIERSRDNLIDELKSLCRIV
jgi:hypothetical protein